MSSLRLSPILATGALVAALASQAVAQAGAPVDLGKRSARSKYTLGRIYSVQELADGRIVASDIKDGVFRIVDLAKGDVTLLGKQGDDPDTYRRASTIVRLPGDSLGLYDAAGRKMLHASAQGGLGAFTPVTPPKRAGILLGADANGDLYFLTPEAFDTVAKAPTGIAGVSRVAPGATTEEPQLTYRTRRTDQTRPGAFMPFFFRDAVALRSDGLLARVVSDTYQVIWSRNGKETGRTGPLPWEKIPIPPAEQQAIKDSTIAMMRNMSAGGGGTRTISMGSGTAGFGTGAASVAPGGAVEFGAGGGGGQTVRIFVNGGAAGGDGGGGGRGAPMPAGAPGAVPSGAPAPIDMKAVIDQMAAQPLGTFPEYKPPMPSGAQSSVMFDAAGMLWIPRERAHGDPILRYDVVAEGKGLVGQVKLPAGTRLVGFGTGVVYLARLEDADEWLERYPMPKF